MSALGFVATLATAACCFFRCRKSRKEETQTYNMGFQERSDLVDYLNSKYPEKYKDPQSGRAFTGRWVLQGINQDKIGFSMEGLTSRRYPSIPPGVEPVNALKELKRVATGINFPSDIEALIADLSSHLSLRECFFPLSEITIEKLHREMVQEKAKSLAAPPQVRSGY